MKISSCSNRCLALLFLHCTVALAGLSDWSAEVWNKTVNEFEEKVAEEVTAGLADSSLGPGILARIPMGYSR